jgi:Bardet-Biedl syndrome 9 protein
LVIQTTYTKNKIFIQFAGDQTKLQLVYEHLLKKSAYSVCQGNFGGVKGREFLCVTHLDGSLKFFEQDGITYECKLPDDRHIPAPMVYVTRTDCFLTISPAWDLECYRYQDLIEIEREGVPIWSLCIGEWALDYDVHQISK